MLHRYKLHNTYNLQRHDCAAIELAIFVDRHMAHLFWNVRRHFRQQSGTFDALRHAFTA